jgi:hypothetical protein
MEVYHKEEQEMILVVVDEIMCLVEERLLAVDYRYDC